MLRRSFVLLCLLCCTAKPSTDELLARLESRDAGTRWAAAELLVTRRDPRALAYVRRLFAEGDLDTRIRAAGILLDDEAVRFLLGQLRLDEPVAQESMRYHASTEASGIASDVVLQPSVAPRNDAPDERNEFILWMLVRQPRPVSFPYLVAALSSRSFQVRHAARAALVEAGPQIVPLLVRECRRPGNHSLHGPTAVLEVAAALRHADAIPLLVEGLGAKDAFARQAAAEGLVHLGTAARAAVELARQSPDESVRLTAAQVLERLR
jgi:HEAT repeat protein